MKNTLETLKKKWLRDTTKTIILVLILFAIFIGINILIQKLELIDIDVTKNKLYTISESTINQIKNIEDEVKIYLIGFDENTALNDLMKQYNRENEKIKYETIEKIQDRVDIKNKYSLADETQVIIVEAKNQNKIILVDELYTYDYTTYSQIDVSEEKITNAIVNLTLEKKPKIYFLTGHGEYGINTDMTMLKAYLENEINDLENLDLLIKGSIPKDASLLVIASPQKDILESEVEIITKYINNGGKILWLNDPTGTNLNLSNFQKILDLFGAKFDEGIILEQDANKMALSAPNCIIPNISYTNATKDIATDGGILLINSTKITLADDETLETLNVTAKNILTTGETAIFRKELSNGSNSKIAGDEEGSFIIGTKLTKIVNDENEENKKEAEMYLLANNLLVVDYPITVGNSTLYPMQFYNNKDYILNTIAELTEREDTISIRKDTGLITYTATEAQHRIIKILIMIFPMLIIIIGIVIWIVRRRKK
ncbi:MAG: GldG family protein [Clostridia bacterium]|nr:GldG family protein [Clostridia bacterium]